MNASCPVRSATSIERVRSAAYDRVAGTRITPHGQAPTGELRLWDVATGKELPQFAGPQAAFEGVAFAPDGKTLAFTRTLGLFERDIYKVSLSEDMVPQGEPRRLTFDQKQIDGLGWTEQT